MWGRRPGAALCPTADDLVLLPNSGFVSPLDLYRGVRLLCLDGHQAGILQRAAVRVPWQTGRFGEDPSLARHGPKPVRKRLDLGRFFWPQAKEDLVSLTAAQLSMLLEGIDWQMPMRT